MNTQISNRDDLIDSRNVIARIDELEGDDDELDELNSLNALAVRVFRAGGNLDEASGYASDWKYGKTLIRDSYFKEYAQELAEDIGAIPNDVSWPCTCIDWDQAVRELQMDYIAVEFDGVTYWIR